MEIWYRIDRLVPVSWPFSSNSSFWTPKFYSNVPKKVSRQLGRAILEFVLDRAGQTTYSVKKWCLPETSKYLKIIPQSRSPDSKMGNFSFRPRGSNFFELSNRFS